MCKYRRSEATAFSVLTLLYLGLPAWAADKPHAAPQEVHLSKAQLAKYYKVYQAPSVRQLRQTLNQYLNGKCTPIMINDLKKWSKDYYKSKFVVLSVDPAIMGGDFLTIMFQDKPDQVFLVWMYKMGKDLYEFRSIDKREMTAAQLKALKVMYRSFLTDKVHAI